jgi:hypothetical protein
MVKLKSLIFTYIVVLIMSIVLENDLLDNPPVDRQASSVSFALPAADRLPAEGGYWKVP